MRNRSPFFWRKTAVAALAVAATTAALSGCTGLSGGSGSSDNNGPVTLTLLSHYNTQPMKGGLTKLVDEWNKENPKIQVKQQAVNFNDLQTTLNVRQTGGRGADLLSSYALWGGQLAANGVLATPPASVTSEIKADYSKAAVSAVTGPGGKLFGYPTEFATYVLFYNKKILKAAGFDHAPTTWAELQQVAAKTTKKDSSGNLKVEGIALTQDGDAPTAHPTLALLDSAGGTFTDASGKSAIDSKMESTLDLVSKLAKAGDTTMAVMPTKTFPSGGVAMAIQANWWVGTLKSQMKDYATTVGTAPVPGPSAGQKGSLAYAFFMGVNAGSKHQKEAWKFLTWLNSHKGTNGASEMGNFLADNGEIPPRVADASVIGPQLEAKDPNLKPVYAAADYAMAESNTPNAAKAKNDLNNVVQQIIVNHASPQSAYATLQSDLGQ